MSEKEYIVIVKKVFFSTAETFEKRSFLMMTSQIVMTLPVVRVILVI